MADETDISALLRERTALRYMGDCKCGRCQLVPHELVVSAATEIEDLRHACKLMIDGKWGAACKAARAALAKGKKG